MANSAVSDQVDSEQKPTDLDLHCSQMRGISGFSKTRVKGAEQIWQISFHLLQQATSVTSCLLSCTTNPLEKGSTLKRVYYSQAFASHVYGSLLNESSDDKLKYSQTSIAV